MRKLLITGLAVMILMLGLPLAAAFAQSNIGTCPDGYNGPHGTQYVGFQNKDKNGNGYVCLKTKNDGTVEAEDDKLPN